MKNLIALPTRVAHHLLAILRKSRTIWPARSSASLGQSNGLNRPKSTLVGETLQIDASQDRIAQSPILRIWARLPRDCLLPQPILVENSGLYRFHPDLRRLLAGLSPPVAVARHRLHNTLSKQGFWPILGILSGTLDNGGGFSYYFKSAGEGMFPDLLRHGRVVWHPRGIPCSSFL